MSARVTQNKSQVVSFNLFSAKRHTILSRPFANLQQSTAATV
jgi:hypothetical protein